MDRIVAFDLETTLTDPPDTLEFAAISLDPETLRIVGRYQTLIRSEKLQGTADVSGISAGLIAEAPDFQAVAPAIFALLENQIWLGHNIAQFDKPVLQAQFEREDWETPMPSAVLDTRTILGESYGLRAGNLKLSGLAQHLGPWKQRHRAMSDVVLNLRVLRQCATILLLEKFLTPPEHRTGRRGIGGNQLLHALNRAIYAKRTVWVSYDGGAVPLVPRPISPLRWVHFPRMFLAFCHGCQEERNFAFRKLVELRDERWRPHDG